jgi:hypothetical protein
MPFDLALSQHGDLIFSASRDLEYVEGEQLLNQRIINRLRIQRGSWIFNRDSSLGSDLHEVLGKSVEQQIDNVPSMVTTALEPMNDEIDVQSVEIIQETRGLSIAVQYARIVPNLPPEAFAPTTTLIIPIEGLVTVSSGSQGD